MMTLQATDPSAFFNAYEDTNTPAWLDHFTAGSSSRTVYAPPDTATCCRCGGAISAADHATYGLRCKACRAAEYRARGDAERSAS